jgi:hypothetical protein
MIRKIALYRLILSTSKNAEARRYCDLIVAMVVDRLIAPRSKLGFVRVSTGRGISSLWGVQFSPLGGLAISRFLDQRLRFSAVDHDA